MSIYFLSLFMRSTAPGLGYGRCWNSGPDAVTSAPVFAESRVSRPVDHEPLHTATRYRDLQKAVKSDNTNTRLTALCPGLSGWAGTRKVKPIWILLEQEILSAVASAGHVQVCTALQTDNHTSTSPLSFLQVDALPAAQPTVSKHWRLFWTIRHYMIKHFLLYSFALCRKACLPKCQ